MTKRNGGTNINNDKRLSSMSKDIMFEIFLQLPIRDLVQLKLVCKSWNKLITSPMLVECHLKRSKDNSGIMFVVTHHHLDLEPYYISFNDIDHDRSYAIEKLCSDNPYKFLKYYEILDSCNGLVLTLIRLNGDLIFDERLLVCNPMTKLAIFLPIPPCGTGSSLYPHTKHIIYHTSIYKYKVVWRCGEDGEYYIMEVDTSSRQQLTSSWRNITPSILSTDNVRASVSCEGKLHWLMTKKRDIEEKVKLLTLDVATEKFDEMECCLPFDRNNNNPLKFSGSNGKFYHMRVTSWNDFELWDLRDLNNHQPKWFKHQLWINDPTLSIPPLVGWFDFICESQDGGKFIFMRKDRRGFLVYEITTQKFTRLALDEGATVNIDKSTLVHINSLIS
ncbi:hypothetical protein SAY86_009662 [Trapa natans]|uniref:F-box domain-containing protein n=1 Tax=Trapa natans TaxID=22666 RepID=A0AAN7L580_TRANT|nr:hypothetical protein SAY86_009662 [Trapa natans]